MAIDLAAKLRVTADALGCATRKDLCARFRAVNPATHLDLERLHKWMQGKAAPRSSAIYADWARVIGTARPAAWIAGCSLEAFCDEVARLLDVDAAALHRAAGGGVQPAAGAPRRIERHARVLGTYATYSFAWSPYFPGRLVRGGLRLEAGRGGELLATYTELCRGGLLRFQGPALMAERTLNVMLRDPDDACPVFVCLYLPGTPANALCGVMAGSTLLAQDSRPTAGRFAAVRVPEAAPLDATNRYIEPERGVIAADLAALGLPAVAGPEIEAAVSAVLAGDGIDQVPVAAQTRLAEALDRAWLGLPAPGLAAPGLAALA